MTDDRVDAHFHGGPFDGETRPVDEDELHERAVLEETPDGLRLREAPQDGDDAGRSVYRLSAEASGLEGDVEYVHEDPLDTEPGGG